MDTAVFLLKCRLSIQFLHPKLIMMSYNAEEQKARLRQAFPTIREEGNVFYLERVISGYKYDMSIEYQIYQHNRAYFTKQLSCRRCFTGI